MDEFERKSRWTVERRKLEVMRFLVNNRGTNQLFRTNNIAKKLGVSKGVTLRNEDVREVLEYLADGQYVDRVTVDDGGTAYRINQHGLEFWKMHAPDMFMFFSFE
jgi:Fe2+ or Zn2+ uptake regulation protein